ncbi:MAG: TorF family putative porin [Nibricoccus sp.]
MKKTAILLAALAAGAGLNAQDVKSSYSVTTDFTYSSEYVFRGVEAAGNSFQPSVEVSVDDAYIGLWTNTPVVRDRNGGETNEIDLYGGYKYKLNDALSFEAVGTYYWYPEATGGATKDSVEAGLGATYLYQGISSSLYYYYDFILGSDTIQVSVGYSVPLEAIGSSVDFSVFAGNVSGRDVAPDSGRKVMETYNYYGFDISVPYKLNDKAAITTALHYAANDQYFDGSVPDANLWFSVGLSVGF